MNKKHILILVLLSVVVAVLTAILVANLLGKDLVSSSVESIQSYTTTVTTKKYTTMTLHSPAFEDNGALPTEYTCDGSGDNPPLEFALVPENAKSLALIVEDIDVPSTIRTDGLWTHWMVWDMPATTKGIDAGEKPTGTIGQNTSGTLTYSAPCPPDGQHRYVFTLYALDAMLKLDIATTTKETVLEAMEGHVIKTSVLTSVYNRQ
jgi:Raf kinase inhibitor-like YbhB/YbcL family protein